MRSRRQWLGCVFAVFAAAMVGCKGETPGKGPAAGGGTSNETGTAGSGSSASSGAKKRIIILTNGDHPFWDACEAGAKEGEKEFKLADAGLELSFQRANFTVPGQVEKLRQYSLETDIAGLGISVYDDTSPAISDELKKLKEQGVKIVTIDGDVDRKRYRDVRFAYLGTDNLIGGRELGRAAKALRPQGGKYAVFVGNEGNANAKGRINGFIEGAGETFAKVELLNDNGKPEVARKNVRDALDRHSEIDTLVGIWAYNGPAQVDVVEERELLGKVTIVTFDADTGSIKAMEDGKLDVMVVQNPFNMGYQGVKILKALVQNDEAVIKEMYPNHGSPDGDLYSTGLKVVIPDKESPITKDILDSTTQLLKFGEFRDWLKQYKLKSS
jgi:ribose transport system substrate-binding protein